MNPLAIDLFCGLGGWTEGLIAEGYRVVGFDIERRPYPAQLVIQDVLTLHGSQFKDAALIVASPPCQNYSYLAMPWSRSPDWVRPDGDGWEVLNSVAAKEMREKWEREGPDNRLFDACFRIQREAREAAGRYIPMVVENVRGAQPWVGRSAWNYGSFHLWGDVPALMPIVVKGRKTPVSGAWFRNENGEYGFAASEYRKNNGGSWFNIGSPGQTETNRNPVHELTAGLKVPGFRFDGSGGSFQTASVSKSSKDSGGWFNDYKGEHCVGVSRTGSKSSARKQASAMIAKIPLHLSEWIARVYKPVSH